VGQDLEALAVEDEIAARVRARLDELAQVGADPRGGVTRLAYSAQERDAHDLFARWVAEDGRRVEVDEAGNSVAVYAEGTPYFLVGSHLDTVVQGGIYDGAAGVIGGLEAARILGSSNLARGLRVVAFAGEEGARFGRPTLGSSAAAGLLDGDALGRLRDADGTTLVSAAAAIGLDLLAVEPWIGDDIACYFEIHIEQGRQLEAGAARIGLVDAIAGSVRLRFDIRGRADHSGATPMRMRLDALAAASELVLAVEEAARGYRSTVATVGRLEVSPNSVTTVPGQVTLWVDIRDVDADVQRSTANHVLLRAAELAEDRGLTVSGEVISDLAPVVLEAWPRALAHEECESLGLTYRVLPSGAGHDAAIVARQAPATMLFVPCLEGISHSPRETASPGDIAAATSLIAATIARADRLLA
jgi:hydantoinase/carbamoylase family amidase